MTGHPAATLLHLGPGLGNGIANLHNARRARTPVVNLVGDHATYHKCYDPPLESDIDGLALNVSGWVRHSQSVENLAEDVADAVAAAIGPPGQVATLVVPADVAWSEGAPLSPPTRPREAVAVPSEAIDAVVAALRSEEPVALMIGGRATHGRALWLSALIARSTGARLLSETFPARAERGEGVPSAERIAYLPELAIDQLKSLHHLVLVDAPAPVSFFAYPTIQSFLAPAGCEVMSLVAPTDDVIDALERLADSLGIAAEDGFPRAERTAMSHGSLTAEAAAATIGALLPEGAIVSDESNTSGVWLPAATAGAPRHDWLCLTGGAIGQGLAVATGAAIACPDRKVLCLEADGSAMYTIQSLWTQARESLDVTTVIFDNRAYAILGWELRRASASPGPRSQAQFDLTPPLDFAALARGMGVDGIRVETAEDFGAQLARSLDEPGPHLIDAVLEA